MDKDSYQPCPMCGHAAPNWEPEGHPRTTREARQNWDPVVRAYVEDLEQRLGIVGVTDSTYE